MPAAALLIALPQGMTVGGITTWAVRLLNTLVARGHACGLIAHPSPHAHVPIDLGLDPRVKAFGPHGLVTLDNRPTDIDACLPVYRRAVDELAVASGGPVAISPNNHADCYGLAAALARDTPERVRVLGWMHSDIAYDAAVLSHYERAIHRFVAVSDHIERTLRGRLPQRAAQILRVAYGVEIAPMPHRTRARAIGEPLRLVYSGRLEHQQKRVLALPAMARELHARGVAFELRVLGDGPAAEELTHACAGIAGVRLLGAQSPARVAQELARGDVFVLPSRYEGLSIALLEALAAGCVPVVARTESGALEAIEPGVSGLIAKVAPEEDESAAGRALADAIATLHARGAGELQAMSCAAQARARDRFSIDVHARAVEAILQEVMREADRLWPADEPCSFSAPGSRGTGSVPRDGRERLARLLASLADRSVIVHGTGQHTLQLRDVLLASPARIVAFADDDRQKWGGELWGRPIIDPRTASAHGATDAVLSSWMHEAALWARREVYESQGVRTHRVYGAGVDATPTH